MPSYTPTYGIVSNGSVAPYFRKDSNRLDELTRWVRDDMDRWQDRNTRFQADQELYQLNKPADLKARSASDLIILPDPKILVKKLARLIARHPPVIDVPPAPGSPDPTIAQRIENYLYNWDQSQNQRWMMGLKNPYRYDQAFFLLLRGWLTERTMLYPEGIEEYGPNDPMNMWCHDTIDPALVYPLESHGKVVRVTHGYGTTLAELKQDPYYRDVVNSNEYLSEGDDRTAVQCRGIYWESGQDRTWWHAVIAGMGPTTSSSAGSIWLKEPTELGYNPWTISLANGASYRATPWDDLGYIKEIGTGVLDESTDTFKYLNRMATKLSELLSLEANPPASLYSGTGEIKKVTFGPGERNFFAEKDKLELHRIGPQLGDYQMLWDLLEKRAGRAGLPPAFFAEYGGESGFSASIIMAAGKDVLFPFVEAINYADAMKYRKILEIYRDFGPAAPLPSYLPADSMGNVMSAQVSVQDIFMQGTYVKIKREDMTPQELATKINLGLAMLRDKAISLKTFRKEWAGIQNEGGENAQVIAEQVYMSPEVMQAMVPLALSGTGQNMLGQVWSAIQQQMPQNAGQGQPPGPQPEPQGLPSQVLPPNMQNGNPQTNTQVAQGNPLGAEINPFLQLLTGGASGGAGMGGSPPPQGTTSRVPLFRPPGGL